jgi:hypothetical protein
LQQLWQYVTWEHGKEAKVCSDQNFTFGECASLYNHVNKANLVHNFSCMFISILYMFRATVPIIRRNNFINATPGIYHSMWMTVWYAGWDEISNHPYTVTNTGCRMIQLFLLMMGT